MAKRLQSCDLQIHVRADPERTAGNKIQWTNDFCFRRAPPASGFVYKASQVRMPTASPFPHLRTLAVTHPDNKNSFSTCVIIMSTYPIRRNRPLTRRPHNPRDLAPRIPEEAQLRTAVFARYRTLLSAAAGSAARPAGSAWDPFLFLEYFE